MTDEEWIDAFAAATASDAQLRAHGRHYSCSFLLEMGDRSFVVDVHQGRVERIAVDPGPLGARYQFSLRASADTWRRFARPDPEPMYHGIFAATSRRDMKMEGDLLVLMQHLRCLTRHLELLRTTGVPV